MKTIISHFYNEEYLLPWWLNHHKKYFDHGILINYFSDDNSVNIIKEICPTWEIINTKNTSFDAPLIDLEVMEIEQRINGWVVVLNTTEFIIGDFSLLDSITNKTDFFIPPLIMVDSPECEFNFPNEKEDLIPQRTFGCHYKNEENFNFKKSRKMSNYFSKYPMGRHYPTYNTENFFILWYGFSPINEKLIKRKTQIQKNIPESNKINGWGTHHIVTEEQVLSQFKEWQSKSENLKPYIDRFIY